MTVADDSAGGGLAVALLVALRDAGEALPAAAALMSPHLDLTGSGASMTERADQDPILTPAALRQMAADVATVRRAGRPAAAAGADRHGRAAPQRRRAPGQRGDPGRVQVTLQLGEGLPHAYPIMLGTPEAAEATGQIAGSCGHASH
jgi:epsilon-lactone hydrolase